MVTETIWSGRGWFGPDEVEIECMSETDHNLADCDDDALYETVIEVADLIEYGSALVAPADH